MQLTVRTMVYCILLTVCCVLITACAQIVTPDGGPKDRTPPRVVKYSPDSAATNFQGKRIVITFDEYIQLSDVNNQLIISPAVKRRPEVTIRKKELIVEFKDSLEPNTTYSISFGKAIRDITENNVLDNFRFVFSTGPVIDSLRCRGTVVNALTLRGEKNVLVMLYRNTADSTPLLEKPYYYSRTDDNGNFTMTNLAAADYRIFALADEGEDYLFNSSEERIAFADSLVRLRDDVDSLRMFMFNEKPVGQKLMKSSQMAPGRLLFVYNLPNEKPSVDFSPALPAGMDPFIEYNSTGDTINLWFAKVELDSVQFSFRANGKLLDTLAMRLQKPTGKKPVRAGATDYRAFTLTQNANGGKLLPGSVFCIHSTNPIRTIDSSKIVFRMGKDTIHPNMKLSANRRRIDFLVPFPEDSSFSLFIPAAAMIDWYGQKNDTVKASFAVQPGRQFGNLTVKMPDLNPGRYVVEVVDDRDHVVRDTIINGPATISFGTMNGGNYRIRLIKDSNSDGRWTAGNYLGKKQPEKVIYYALSVRVRAGWDMDIEWILQ
jgi:hypothetical protein